MKKLIIKTTVFLLTFLFGLGTLFTWISFTTPLVQVEQPTDLSFESPVETSLCNISDYSSYFNGKLVNFKAKTHAFDSELVLFPLNCYFEKADIIFLGPSIELIGFSGVNSNLIGILQSSMPRTAHPNYKELLEVDIRVIGIVKEFYDQDGMKRYSVVPKKIEIISPFREFAPGGAS